MKKSIYFQFIFCLVIMLPEVLWAQTWSALPSGITDPVNSMVVYNGELYVCASSGFSSVNWVKKWNGTTSTNIGTSGMTGNSYGTGYPPEVKSLAVYNGELYAAGNFAFVDGNPDTCIARWNGFNWSAVPGSWGNPPDHRCGDVLAMTVSNNALYIGGQFCGVQNYCQRWDGTSWTPLPSIGSVIFSLCDFNNVLYAGCQSGAKKLYNGVWSNVAASGNPGGTVHALTVINNELYAGGEFFGSYNSIEKWNGSVWSALGTGMGGTPVNGNLSVNAITSYGSEIYAAGNFTTAGGTPANFIAKWNGANWSAAGSGTNSPVNALAVYNNDLFVGGQFSTAGGLSALRIAKWNAPACVLPSAAITAAGSTTFCSGGSVVLNAVVAANRTYQWKKNGTAISGATFSNYTASTSGTYKVFVTNTLTGCSKTSGTGTLVTVYSNPTASIIPQGPTTFCAGDSVQLKTNYNNNYSYTWKKNNVNISGATSNKYEVKTSGSYKVKATNTNGCTVISNAVSVNVPCKEESLNTGISLSEIKIFPNPTSDQFSFKLGSLNDNHLQIKLFDLSGRMVWEKETGNYNQDFQFGSDLLPGIYFLQINEGNPHIKLCKTR